MSPRRSGYQKKLDSVHWTNGGVFVSALSSGTIGATFLNAQHLPETLLRIRGEFTAWPSAAGAPGRAIFVTVGLILVPEGTGTTVTWSPFSDADAPWIWWDTAMIAHEEMVVDVIACQNVLSVRKVIDNKAMRRIRNQELQLVVENTTAASAMAVDVNVDARVLSGQS